MKEKQSVGKVTLMWLGISAASFLILLSVVLSTMPRGGTRNMDSTTKQTTSDNKKEKFSGTKNETTTETIKYTSSTAYDPNTTEGKTWTQTTGVNGVKTITYEVTYENDREVSRKKTSEKVTKQPINEVIVVGTKHTYTGYCSVNGTYRHRYASCVGDYSPQAKANAESKANECNVNSRAVYGCYNTYY